MKILFTYFIASGGIETLNRIRCRSLSSVGIEAHVLYLEDGAGRQNMMGMTYFITNNDHEIRMILNNNHYDAIIVTCDHLMLERLRGLGYSGALIYETQGLGTRDQARSTLKAASHYIHAYAQAAISPPTSHLMELFHYYLAGVQCFYVQNLIDTEKFVYQEAKWLNPSGKGPILGWIGRLEHNKDWRLFLRISAALSHQHKNLQIWMFEDANLYEPGEREKFSELIHELSLLPILTLRSNVPHDQMAHYLSEIGDSGGMLISTSFVEGFGYAVGEAMCCRCPVLSTDSDGVRSFIDHNRTGKFFITRTIEDAVKEANILIHDRPVTAYIRDQAVQHIRTNFSLTRYAADIVNILVALRLRPYSPL